MVALHEHRLPYISLTLSGGFEDRAENCSDWCLPGSVMLRPSGVRHATRYGETMAKQVSVDFGPPFDPEQSRALIHSPAVVADPELAVLLKNMHRELLTADTWSDLVLEGLAHQLLGKLGRSSQSIARPSWTRMVEDRLRDEKTEPCISALAAMARLPPSRFAIEFKHWFHVSPGAYLRRLRVERAENLMIRSDLSLSEIALAVGFSDHPHFTREFKKARGATPRDFRRNAR